MLHRAHQLTVPFENLSIHGPSPRLASIAVRQYLAGR